MTNETTALLKGQFFNTTWVISEANRCLYLFRYRNLTQIFQERELPMIGDRWVPHSPLPNHKLNTDSVSRNLDKCVICIGYLIASNCYSWGANCLSSLLCVIPSSPPDIFGPQVDRLRDPIQLLRSSKVLPLNCVMNGTPLSSQLGYKTPRNVAYHPCGMTVVMRLYVYQAQFSI